MSDSTKLITRSTCNGFTLIELMVASTIGLVITTGIISLFVFTMKNNSDTLKQIRLHQEMRAILDVISRDVRRAGYWRNADGMKQNPFGNITISEDGSCITYSYDTDPNQDPNLGNEDNFGMRFINNAIKLRSKSTTCDSNKFWQTISSDDSVKFTDLKFSLTTLCENISSDNGSCENAESGDTLSTKNALSITLSGELYDDDRIALSLHEQVSIRNIESRLQP